MPETSACLSARQLADLAGHRLTGTDAEIVLAHLGRCAACSAALAALPRSDETTSLGPPDPLNTPPPVVSPLSPRPRSTPSHPYQYLMPDSTPGTLGRLGDYLITDVVGQGGMGVVFAAEDSRLNRKVALKILRPEVAFDAGSRERFLREARAMAAVTHDYIVPIYHVGEAETRMGDVLPFFTMPLLAGESLETFATRFGQVPAPEVARIGRQMASGLAAAHAVGLVHRDIKPPNVWLEDPPSTLQAVERRVSGFITLQQIQRRVKLLDFGLARSPGGSGELTGTHAVMGTPRYMSPEQALGETIDGRSDLFSLGAVLYRLLTGRGPFDQDDVRATLTAVVVKDPPPLATLAPATPPELIRLLDQLLAKKPSDRPASAAEVAERLRIIEERPSSSDCPPCASPPAPPRRWTDWVIAGAALAALILVACQAFRWFN